MTIPFYPFILKHTSVYSKAIRKLNYKREFQQWNILSYKTCTIVSHTLVFHIVLHIPLFHWKSDFFTRYWMYMFNVSCDGKNVFWYWYTETTTRYFPFLLWSYCYIRWRLSFFGVRSWTINFIHRMILCTWRLLLTENKFQYYHSINIYCFNSIEFAIMLLSQYWIAQETRSVMKFTASSLHITAKFYI